MVYNQYFFKKRKPHNQCGCKTTVSTDAYHFLICQRNKCIPAVSDCTYMDFCMYKLQYFDTCHPQPLKGENERKLLSVVPFILIRVVLGVKKHS
jgi:hypothetical protein